MHPVHNQQTNFGYVKSRNVKRYHSRSGFTSAAWWVAFITRTNNYYTGPHHCGLDECISLNEYFDDGDIMVAYEGQMWDITEDLMKMAPKQPECRSPEDVEKDLDQFMDDNFPNFK